MLSYWRVCFYVWDDLYHILLGETSSTTHVLFSRFRNRENRPVGPGWATFESWRSPNGGSDPTTLTFNDLQWCVVVLGGVEWCEMSSMVFHGVSYS